MVASREKHEGNEGEDGDQGASPPAIFLFKTFDTSRERFRGPQTSSAVDSSGMILPPWLVRIEVQIETYHNRFAFFRQQKLVFGTNVVTMRIVRKGKGRLSRAKSNSQTDACSGLSDNIRKANTELRR
jgi:hypothetical protein